MKAENLSRSNNNVSLSCRMKEDRTQWYEFSIESGGIWYLYAYLDGVYNLVNYEGTTSLNQGLAVNEYGMTCEGQTISLYVNGNLLKTVSENKCAFIEGHVGLNICSLKILPIKVAVKSFKIAQP